MSPFLWANMKLTPKQKQFCIEYLIDLNATQAAIRAKYSKKTATEMGYENLRKPHIQKEIGRLNKDRSDKTEITVQRVLEELARIAFLDPKDIFDKDMDLLPLSEMSEDARRAIAGIETVSTVSDKDSKYTTKKVKLINKDRALELIGRHLEMFTDRLKVDENIRIIVEDLRDSNIDDN